MNLFGTELPIIQAPMAGVQGIALAAAVSSAGGLGSIPCGMLNASEVAAMRGPFNLNFFCHTAPAIDEKKEAAWRATLAPYYAELGVTGGGEGPARSPFNAELAAVVEELRPPVVSFHYGLPSDDLLERVRRTGAKIISSATTVAEARWLESRGVDAVIAQGFEAGGHRGMFLTEDITTQMGTLALVPQIVEAVGVPVIAAGGIADAASVAAALRLGASYVQVGTAYLLCPEATTSDPFRGALRSEAARHTAITNVFTGRPARAIVNRAVRELGPMRSDVPSFPRAALAMTPLRVSPEFSPFLAGQSAPRCRAISAAELTRELAPK